MRKLRVLDLFSGIGGISLGLESTGAFETVAFCEIEAFPAAVLRERWPGVPVYSDVRDLDATKIAVDVVVGGFPCQDVSLAGRGAGVDRGSRSGLWAEMARIIGECRPAWVLAENVPALRARGADRVLGDLDALGYTCWPLVVGADHAGAPHKRRRVWLVAHRNGHGREGGGLAGWHAALLQHGAGSPGHVPDGHPDAAGLQGLGGDELRPAEGRGFARGPAATAGLPSGEDRRLLADTDSVNLRQFGERGPEARRDDTLGTLGEAAALCGQAELGAPRALPERWPARPGERQREWEAPRIWAWRAQLQVGESVDGFPERLARRWNRESLRALGNSVVPQIVAAIGRTIYRIDRVLTD